jgi:hypothetical protein
MASDLTTDDNQSVSTALNRILEQGCALVRLDNTEASSLKMAYEEGMEFFAMDAALRLRHGVPTRITGYRPYAYAHAGDPDKPDLNDSFLYWPHRREELENHKEINTFLDALEAYRVVAARIVHALFAQLREHSTTPPSSSSSGTRTRSCSR